MKKFFLNLLSSFMGAWIALLLFSVVGVIVIIGIIARLGGDEESKPYAAEKAGIKDDKYGIAIYPKYEPNVLDMIMTQGLSQLNQEISKIAGEDPKSILVNEASRVLQRNPCQARLTPLTLFIK